MPAVPGFKPPVKALCVVPQGMEEGSELLIEGQEFGLVTGEPAEFRFFSSEVRSGDAAGQILPDAETGAGRDQPARGRPSACRWVPGRTGGSCADQPGRHRAGQSRAVDEAHQLGPPLEGGVSGADGIIGAADPSCHRSWPAPVSASASTSAPPTRRWRLCRSTEDAASEVFAVPQWDSSSTLAAGLTLPSFLYLPENAAAAQLRGRAPRAEWIIGLLARKKAHEVPGRVAHSAKSWLCHHAADREAPILAVGVGRRAAGGQDLAGARVRAHPRLSAQRLERPLRAGGSGSRIRFRCAGDHHRRSGVVRCGRSAPHPCRRGTRRLSRHRPAIGRTAGRLLQLAGTARLRHASCGAGCPHGNGDCCHILVVDVGGGTSDFSLFEVRPNRRGAEGQARWRSASISFSAATTSILRSRT